MRNRTDIAQELERHGTTQVNLNLILIEIALDIRELLLKHDQAA